MSLVAMPRRKLLKVLLALVCVIACVELWRSFDSVTRVPRWFRTRFRFAPDFALGSSSNLRSHTFKIHDRLRFTLFYSLNESTSNIEAEVDTLLVGDLDSLLDQRPTLHLVEIGATSGVFSVAAAVKGRRVVVVPSNPEAAGRVQAAIEANGVQGKIRMVGNLSPNGLRSAIDAVDFKEAVLRVDLDLSSITMLFKSTSVLSRLQLRAVWVRLSSAKKPPHSFLSDLLSRQGFQPFSRLVGDNKLPIGKPSSWPNDVAWRRRTEELGPHSLRVFNLTGNEAHQFPVAVVGKVNGQEVRINMYHASDYITRSITSGNGWERSRVQELLSFLQKDPALQFIDIGCYIGVYTLQVAALGRSVVAVDANRNNLLRVAKSVVDNGLQERVVLVHNAMDSEYATMFMNVVQNNVGGSFVVTKGPKETEVVSIHADDLLQVIKFKRAVLKIDIEGKEGPLLRYAAKLFSTVDIPIVLFEWATKHVDRKADAKFIFEFMTSRGYAAFPSIFATQPLPSDYNKFPWDIVWKRKKVAPYGVTGIPGDSRIQLFTAREVNQTFLHYQLRTPGGTLTIYGYGTNDYISRSIASTGQWEAGHIADLARLLNNDPTLQLIDVGTNIGVYALAAAKLGRKVVAVDANMMNVLRLRKSTLTASLQDKVKIVWNAIDRTYTTVHMKLVSGNIGGSFVVDSRDKSASSGTEVQTITMDDLLKVIDFKKAIMKYDIEGKEYDGLHNASRLFSEVDIPVVFMEWGVINRDYKKYGGRKIPEFIIKFFTSRNYVGVAGPFSSTPLAANYNTWPWDIAWRKKSPQEIAKQTAAVPTTLAATSTSSPRSTTTTATGKTSRTTPGTAGTSKPARVSSPTNSATTTTPATTTKSKA